MARNVAPNALGSRTAARCTTFGSASGPTGATNSMADLTADHIVLHLDLAGYVIMKKPPALGGATI
jgi:hypothetical protein